MITEKLISSIFQSAISGQLFNNFISENTDDLERPFTIPKSWKWIKFKEIGEFYRGNGIKRTDVIENGFPCIRYGEIYTSYNYKFSDSISSIPKELFEKCRTIKKNDLVFTLTGESEYEIAKTVTYLGEKDIAIGGDMGVFTNHNQNPLYLTYFMYSPYAINCKAKNSTGKMIVHTSLIKIQEMYVPLPPKDVQDEIVIKIEKLLNKLNEINPIELEIKNLKTSFPDKIRKSLLQDAFSGKWTSSEQFENWNKSKLDGILEIVTGNSISESIKKNKYMNLSSGYNYIGTKDLDFNHLFNYNNGVKIPFGEKGFKLANKDDVLMCIEGGSAGKKIGILNETVCYGNKLCKLSIKDKKSIDEKFIYYYLLSPMFQKNFYDNVSGLIGGVSISKIRNIILNYPSLIEQQRIVEKLEQLLPLCADIDNLINK